jgi:protein-tyrosine phosphatase
MTTMGLPAPILTCAPNFRDIGGYSGADGRTVRHGQVFRSQLIIQPTEADLATLRRINIRTVCDLRGEHERRIAPNSWVEQPFPVLMDLNIGMDVRAGAGELLAIIAGDPTVRGVRKMMMFTYALLPRAFEGKIGPVLDDIIAGVELPLLIHCTAGKDRTGFLSALILLTLGVSLDEVHYDYALTEKYTDMDRMMAASAAYLKSIVGNTVTADSEMLRLLCGTSPDYLNAALGAIEKDYGSVENYLAQTAGFDAVKREKLRERLLG